RKLEDIYLPVAGKLQQQTKYLWLRNEWEERLYRDLIAWRHKIAVMHRVSQHAILTERSIFEIVKQKPQNNEELRQIYGIGESKLERFAPELISLINMQNIN
ncbi:MAG: recQ, partial [Burkholderiales bacterium]|nr:recQ [Burkholderiales bacterium]